MKKVIFLIDMNAFYISCEQTRRPEIKGKPAAVAGDPKKRTGIILTANYEARKFGVRTAMTLGQAMRLCPHLITVPPDHDFYQEKSNHVMDILLSYTPVIEQNSIDEAWLDMTGCEGLSGPPVTAAKRIMGHILNETGLWCSIGISENKFLSKMASDMKKPLGITELWPKDIEHKLWPLPVSKMYGVGKKTAQKLQNMGIATIKDLALYDRMQLINNIGKNGATLSLNANGIDLDPVTPHKKSDMKSIGRSTTLPEDTSDLEYAKKVLLELSDDVAMTARKYQKMGRTVQIIIKYSDFKSITRQMTVPKTFQAKEIFKAGVKLLESNWSQKPIRLIGISLSGFDEQTEYEQISLFDVSEGKEVKNNSSKNDEIEKTIYSIREKYGSKVIKRGYITEDPHVV